MLIETLTGNQSTIDLCKKYVNWLADHDLIAAVDFYINPAQNQQKTQHHTAMRPDFFRISFLRSNALRHDEAKIRSVITRTRLQGTQLQRNAISKGAHPLLSLEEFVLR
jgi:hypothetical protein